MCKLRVGLLNLVELKAVIFDFKMYNDYTNLLGSKYGDAFFFKYVDGDFP